MKNDNLARWHKAVLNLDSELLGTLLDENVEFHSPTVWKPYRGREVVQFILMSVSEVSQNFRYHREWEEGNDVVLEFSATVRDCHIKGIDLIKWNDEGKIINFEVLIRPMNGLQAMFEEMSARVKKAGFA